MKKMSAAWVLVVGVAVSVAGGASAQSNLVPATPTNTLKSLSLSASGLSTVRIVDQYGEFASVGFYMTATSTRGTAEWARALPSTTTVKTGTSLSLQIRFSTGADNATIASQLHACTVLAKQRGASTVYMGFKSGYAGATFSTIESNGTSVNANVDASALTHLHCD